MAHLFSLFTNIAALSPREKLSVFALSEHRTQLPAIFVHNHSFLKTYREKIREPFPDLETLSEERKEDYWRLRSCFQFSDIPRVLGWSGIVKSGDCEAIVIQDALSRWFDGVLNDCFASAQWSDDILSELLLIHERLIAHIARCQNSLESYRKKENKYNALLFATLKDDLRNDDCLWKLILPD